MICAHGKSSTATRHLIELDGVDGLRTRHQNATVVMSDPHEESNDE